MLYLIGALDAQRAASRGSCVGDIQWAQEGHHITAVICQTIPGVNSGVQFISDNLKFVLCVESDSAFQLLSPYVAKPGSPLEHCLLLTSNGYTNKNFKRFLLHVVTYKPTIPVLVLVDFDM